MDRLKSFVSKKLIAFALAFIALVVAGEIAAAQNIALAYIGGQSLVDALGRFKGGK